MPETSGHAGFVLPRRAWPLALAHFLSELQHGQPTDRVRLAWDALQGLPFGRWLFSRILSEVAPYSGSVRAEMLELRNGYARAVMRDRRRVRNHLRCLHAIALANLAEFTGNLALAYSIPGDARFIVTAISMEYLQKARGDITATCNTAMPADSVEREIEISVDLWNTQSQLVCRCKLISQVGPRVGRSADLAAPLVPPLKQSVSTGIEPALQRRRSLDRHVVEGGLREDTRSISATGVTCSPRSPGT